MSFVRPVLTALEQESINPAHQKGVAQLDASRTSPSLGSQGGLSPLHLVSRAHSYREARGRPRMQDHSGSRRRPLRGASRAGEGTA